jgi:hypothetical protein
VQWAFCGLQRRQRSFICAGSAIKMANELSGGNHIRRCNDEFRSPAKDCNTCLNPPTSICTYDPIRTRDRPRCSKQSDCGTGFTDSQDGGSYDGNPFFDGWDALPLDAKVKGMYGGNTMHSRLANSFLQGIVTFTAKLQYGYVPGSVRQDKTYTTELCPPQWETWVRICTANLDGLP